MKSQGSRSDYAVMSYAQVGRALGISAMRVCQLEKRALKKMRTKLEDLRMCSTVAQALKILRPPLKFGDDKQIAARRFLEEVETAKAMVLACEKADHKENTLERFDEDELTKNGHIYAMQEELNDCSCTPRVSSEALLEVAKAFVNEWWRW